MENLLTIFTTFFSSIFGIITVILGGLFYVVGLWKGKKDDAHIKADKEKDEAGNRLISLLQTTVSELESKVNQQTEDIKKLSERVNLLTTENEILMRTLQGKDKDTKEFQKRMLEISRNSNEILKQNGLKIDLVLSK